LVTRDTGSFAAVVGLRRVYAGHRGRLRARDGAMEVAEIAEAYDTPTLHAGSAYPVEHDIS